MSRSLFDAPPISSQLSQNYASRYVRCSVSLVSCLLIPLLMSGCVYHHPPMPVQKATLVVPKPAPRLLAKMPEPKCTYTDEEPAAASNIVTAKAESTDSTSDAPSPAAEQAASHVAALEEAVQRRERERDCFRDAEARARARLAELQASVRVMMQEMDKQKRKLASAR